MLELLTVIGIIVILAGLLLAVRGVINRSKRSATQVILKNLQGMYGEMKATVPTFGPKKWPARDAAGVVQPVDIAVAPFNDPELGLSFWTVPYRSPLTKNGATIPAWAPAGAMTSDNPSRFSEDALRETARAISYIFSAKANQEVLSKLPSGQLLKIADIPGTTDVDEGKYPFVLDGWGNPVIFVPGSGLGRCNPDPSKGAFTTTHKPDGTPETGVVLLEALTSVSFIVRAPDGQSFFASAGPDGNFQTGDDNVYSFEQ
jgi:hypothetical protein